MQVVFAVSRMAASLKSAGLDKTVRGDHRGDFQAKDLQCSGNRMGEDTRKTSLEE